MRSSQWQRLAILEKMLQTALPPPLPVSCTPAECHHHHHQKLHSSMLAANMNNVLVLFANALWFAVTACCTVVLSKLLLFL